MNYIQNEAGEIQVRTLEGRTKFIPLKLAENAMLMRTYKFEVMEAPVRFEIPEIAHPEIAPEIPETTEGKELEVKEKRQYKIKSKTKKK